MTSEPRPPSRRGLTAPPRSPATATDGHAERPSGPLHPVPAAAALRRSAAWRDRGAAPTVRLSDDPAATPPPPCHDHRLPPAPPVPPPPVAAARGVGRSGWHAFTAGAVRLSTSTATGWSRSPGSASSLLSVLLLISAAILQHLPPFSYTVGSVAERHRRTVVDHAAEAADAAASPRTARGARAGDQDREEGHARAATSSSRSTANGVRISPHARSTATAVASRSGRLVGGSGAAASARRRLARRRRGVEIKLPPGADSEEVREAVEEARAGGDRGDPRVAEAGRRGRAGGRRGARRATSAASSRRSSAASGASATARIGDFLTDLAWLVIVASAILKISYKRHDPGRGRRPRGATETAESEQLKRQVVEARMAAMQAQVEPHFLFNTLASIDHLIETDPPRASQMQKNLIALLRASMPSMRESNAGGAQPRPRDGGDPALPRDPQGAHGRAPADRASRCPRACCRPSSRR